MSSKSQWKLRKQESSLSRVTKSTRATSKSPLVSPQRRAIVTARSVDRSLDSLSDSKMSGDTRAASSEFMRLVMEAVFCEVALHRQLLPRSAFSRVSFLGGQCWTLNSSSFVGRRWKNVVIAVSDAIDNQYLRDLMIMVYEDGSRRDEVMEAFTLTFGYGEDGGVITLYDTLDHLLVSFAYVDRPTMCKQLASMLSETHNMVMLLNPLPSYAQFTLKLSYYDYTPEEYEPRGFGPTRTRYHFKDSFCGVTFGSVFAKYHGCCARGETTLIAISEDSDGENDSGGDDGVAKPSGSDESDDRKERSRSVLSRGDRDSVFADEPAESPRVEDDVRLEKDTEPDRDVAVASSKKSSTSPMKVASLVKRSLTPTSHVPAKKTAKSPKDGAEESGTVRQVQEAFVSQSVEAGLGTAEKVSGQDLPGKFMSIGRRKQLQFQAKAEAAKRREERLKQHERVEGYAKALDLEDENLPASTLDSSERGTFGSSTATEAARLTVESSTFDEGDRSNGDADGTRLPNKEDDFRKKVETWQSQSAQHRDVFTAVTGPPLKTDILDAPALFTSKSPDKKHIFRVSSTSTKKITGSMPINEDATDLSGFASDGSG